MAEPTGVLTADDLLTLREGGWQHELRRGELIRTAPASEGHGHLEASAVFLLVAHVRQHRLGRVYSDLFAEL